MIYATINFDVKLTKSRRVIQKNTFNVNWSNEPNTVTRWNEIKKWYLSRLSTPVT